MVRSLNSRKSFIDSESIGFYITGLMNVLQGINFGVFKIISLTNYKVEQRFEK